MLAALLVLTIFGAQFDQAELDGIEREIASLEGQRQGMRTFADNAKRDEVDRQIALLRKVRDRASSVIAARYEACLAHAAAQTTTPGAPVPPIGPQLTNPQTAQCAGVGSGVVSTIRRIEEIREQLARRTWTFSDVDERRALQREAESLEKSL